MSEIINPQDAELEEIILGSCLIESKAITLIADILRPEAFYTLIPQHFSLTIFISS